MIDALYNDTCNILRRDDTVKYGGDAGHTHSLHKSDEPCLWIPKIGKSISVNAAGESVIVNGFFRMNEEPFETDRIQYKGYDYEVNLVQEKKDIVTGVIHYYLAGAERQRISNEDNDPAKAVVIQ